MSLLKIEWKSSDRLVLDRSRLGSGLTVLFLVLFFTAWYMALSQNQNEDGNLLFKAVFYLAPLLFLTKIWKQFKYTLQGETFIFAKRRGLITRNGLHIAEFGEIQAVQVRKIGNSEDTFYRLSLLLSSGGKLFVESSGARDYIYGLADDIAHILDVNIVSK